MRTTRFLAAFALLSLSSASTLTLVPTAAHAQADDPATQAARQRFIEGNALFDKGQFEQARASFKQAYALKAHWSIALNLAHTDVKADHALEAAEYYNIVLKDAQTPPEKHAEAEKGLAEARAKIGRLDVQVPAGSEIDLDGKKIGFAPMDPLDVEPGAHNVLVKGPQGANEQRVIVSAGQLLPVKFGAVATTTTTPTTTTTTTPTTTTPENGTGTGTGGTTGTTTTTTPETGTGTTTTPPAGGGDTSSKPGILSPPQTLWPVFALGAVGLGGFGLSIGFAVAKSGAQSAADDTQAQITKAAKAYGRSSSGICNNPPTSDFVTACNNYKSDVDHVNQDATIANVGIAIGVVGIVGAVVYYLVAPKKGSTSDQKAAQSRPLLVPWVGEGTGGMNVLGRF